MFSESGQERPTRRHEYPCIPEILSRSEITLCCSQIGLLDECLDRIGKPCHITAMIHLDIAIACLGPIRRDTEEDYFPILSKLLGLQYIITKSLTRSDHMIGRTSEDGLIEIDAVFEEVTRDERECGSGISLTWFDDDMVFVESPTLWYIFFTPCHGSSEAILALSHRFI